MRYVLALTLLLTSCVLLDLPPTPAPAPPPVEEPAPEPEPAPPQEPEPEPLEPIVETDTGLLADGLFWRCTTDEPEIEVDLPGRPRRVAVRFDLQLGEWQGPLFHAVAALRAPDRLLVGLMVRADRERSIVDLGDGTQVAGALQGWRAGELHHVELLYAPPWLELEVSAEGRRHHMTVRVPEDALGDGAPVRLLFGQQRTAQGAFYPPIGWEARNLRVEVLQ